MNHYPANTKGFHDVFGNVWQWMEDHFNGFPGMKTTFLYDDFSTECFDGKHNIILVSLHKILYFYLCFHIIGKQSRDEFLHR